MKKIGITCYPTIGGSGIIATELGMLLANKGYEVHFITSSLPFRLDSINPNIYYHEVEISHYPVFQYPPYDLALAAKMAEVIDREKLDVLHVHYAMPHAISAILARDIAKHDVKIVTTLHGTDITVLANDQTFKPMITYGIEKSDAVTAVSQALVDQTKTDLQVAKQIEVIYNFVNENEYYKKDRTFLREKYDIKANEKILIHISNFRKVKRIEDVIQTFYKVNLQVTSKLILVGDGPELNQVFNLVKELDIEEKVLFLGRQKNISDLLSIADVKLLMSDKESFGLVLLEAMACETICVATNVGGIPEVIEHGKTGFLVDKGDTDSAAAYVIQILSDETAFQKIIENSLYNVNNKFHSKEIVKQYINIYKQITAQP